MRKLGILGKPRIKRKRTTNSNHSDKQHPNRVLNLAIERPDQVWVAVTPLLLQAPGFQAVMLVDINGETGM
ncbi:hypothetical protein [Myxacorys almedinensis]|uniref:hypothetical protein n=1 Tax=Myxacorys almedinensis TaxID=2651157 RepID=UPI003B75B900